MIYRPCQTFVTAGKGTGQYFSGRSQGGWKAPSRGVADIRKSRQQQPLMWTLKRWLWWYENSAAIYHTVECNACWEPAPPGFRMSISIP